MSNPGQFLANKRIEIGLSQAELANKLGYSPQMISNWERNKVYPDLSIWSAYASILNVDLHSFIMCKNAKSDTYCETLKFDANKFANNLKLLRRKHRLTQFDLANKLNINTKTVLSYEKGKSYPSLAIFIKLCDLYALKANELYFVIEEAPIAVKKSTNNRHILIPTIISAATLVAVAGITIGAVASSTIKREKASISNSEVSSSYEPEIEISPYYIYKIEDAVGHNNPNATMKGKGTGEERMISSTWLTNDLTPGHYKVKLSVRLSGIDWDYRTFKNMYPNDPAGEMGDKEDEDPYRYWIEVDDVPTYPDVDKTWGEMNLIYEEFHECLFITDLNITEESRTIKLVHGNIGYSCYIEYIKLVSIV